MERSLGATSTSSQQSRINPRDSNLFANKNPFATPRQSGAGGGRGPGATGTTGSATSNKSVRFSPPQWSGASSGASNGNVGGGGGGAQTLFQPQASYSTSPPSRVSYSLAGTPTSSLGNGGGQPMSNGGLAVPGVGSPSPAKSNIPSASSNSPFASNARTQVTLPIKVVPESVKKPEVKHTVLLGRGEVATRLRVNSVLLVGFWLSSRTNLYGYASGYLVQIVPSLDSPLHLLESSILLLLFYNIADSLYRLNQLSSLPAPSSSRSHSPTRLTTSSTSPLPPTGLFRTPASATSSPFGTPIRSSPKTRPSPSPSTPISPLRSTSAPSPSQQQIQTPSTYNLRKSLLNYNTGSVSPSSLGGAGSQGGGEESGLMNAYLARHSPMSSKLNKSVNSREAIDRLLED